MIKKVKTWSMALLLAFLLPMAFTACEDAAFEEITTYTDEKDKKNDPNEDG